MNEHQLKIYRMNLLHQLNESRIPVLIKTLQMGLMIAGFSKTLEDEVEKELSYLISKGFVSMNRHGISAGFKRYIITAEGIEFVESNI